MALPGLSYSRADGNTGSARAAPLGVIAVIAACLGGVAAKPTSITTKSQQLASFDHGELSELVTPILEIANKRVVACKVAASTTGSYGTFSTTGAPGASPSAITAGATKPVDRFNVVVKFLTGATVGVAGATYQVALDGKTFSPVTALGTANSIVIPDTGITIALAAGAIAAGEKVTFTTKGPTANLSDIQPCLDALKATGLEFEAILIGSVEADATLINGVRTALNGFMSRGLSKRAFINVRPWDSASESAQDYQTALATISNAARIGQRVDVCADGGFYPSPIRGISMWRPTSLHLAARVAKISLGTDAAYVDDGPLDGVSIVDSNGNAVCWDESATPGLDDLGFVTLRTFARRAGAFIGNPRVFSPVSSDFVFDQQERCMCAAEERSYDFLTNELSAKKRKSLELGPNGEVYMLEADVADMETRATLDVQAVLRGEVSDARIQLSRNDDVGANSGGFLTVSVEISSLIYLKGMFVTTRFVRTFTV